jgi:deazaflavin-dependent oxidoreductase (nitroreductase family)
MTTKTIYHRMKAFNQRMAANLQRGIGPTKMVLLLTTTGRRSGLRRVTPLQFEEIDGAVYIGSARGQEADWFKNIIANPQVHVRMYNREFDAVAEPVTDPKRVADFIEYRVKRRPVMLRLIMFFSDGLPFNYTRDQLENYCEKRAMVILRPASDPAG